MIRLNLVLLLAVLASALYLVNVQYESRRLFAELDRVRSETRRLEVDNARWQVEKRAQATPLRVEKLAKEALQMRTASPAITLYVARDGRSVVAARPGDESVPGRAAGAGAAQ